MARQQAQADPLKANRLLLQFAEEIYKNRKKEKQQELWSV